MSARGVSTWGGGLSRWECVCLEGGLPRVGAVSAWGGGYLPRGVSSQGDVCQWGCLGGGIEADIRVREKIAQMDH